MKCRKNILIIAFIGIFLPIVLLAADSNLLLPEGLEFRQVEGTARLHERTKAWRFVTAKTLSERKLAVPAGTELTILPGKGLDKIIAYAGEGVSVPVRIDAIITQYRKTNFLYLFDAVPLTAVAQASTPTETPVLPKEDAANILRMAADPNQSSVIPSDSPADAAVPKNRPCPYGTKRPTNRICQRHGDCQPNRPIYPSPKRF